jgi:hypothetical protein
VIDFIARRNAALPPSFVGVRQADIDAVQTDYGITLPSAYVNFLRTMGEHSGELYPFGQMYVHAFSKLLEQLPPEDYPADRFFRVVFVAQEFATDPIDTYLDLARSDGHDAPLVDFETPFGASETNFGEDHLSFAERLIYNIFRRLDMDQRKYGAQIVVFDRNSKDLADIKHVALDVLSRSGLIEALPDLQRVGCLSREAVSAMVSISNIGKLVMCEISGNNMVAIEQPVRELLAAFPDAKLSQPPAERTTSPQS